MNTSYLTDYDKQWLEQLRHIFQNIEAHIYFNSLTNAFDWYYSEAIDKIDYKEYAIESYFNDIKYGTKTHNYNIFNYIFYNKEVRDEMAKTLFNEQEQKCSAYLIGKMLDISGKEEDGLTQYIFMYGVYTSNVSLLLDIMKKGTHYYYYFYEDNQKKHALHQQKISRTINFYELLKMTNDKQEIPLPLEKMQHNFISHIKNSVINISEAKLIELYVNIFSNKNLDYLYQAFNIQKEEIFSLNEKQYTSFNLSLKTLTHYGLVHVDIIRLAANLKSEKINFPSFNIVKTDANYIQCIVEKGEINEIKLKLLFEHLLVHQQKSKDNDSQIIELKDITEMINEKVTLDYILKEKTKKVKLKV